MTKFTARIRRTRAAALVACLLVSSCITGCALLKRPEAVTAIGLAPPAGGDWPAGIEPGQVGADAGLRSDRVVVIRDVARMQHEGLRWIDAPSVLLTEHLRLRRARAGGIVDPGAARLDLQLTAFQLRVDQQPARVEVAASALLRCDADGVIRYLAPVAIAIEPRTDDAASLAGAFGRASESLVGRILAQAAAQPLSCAGETIRAAADGDAQAR